MYINSTIVHFLFHIFVSLMFLSISIQLPNRLGKMLAPLHWHDYKKKYGKLDDFVAGHPEVSSITLQAFFC